MNIPELDKDASDLLAHWDKERGNAFAPHYSFIDPVKLRRWVGDISVVHLHDGPKRFFVSLHGANVARHLGPDFHQKYLEDVIPPVAREDTLAPYLVGMKTGQPTYSIQMASSNNGLYKTLERMVLPCSGATSTNVERFLVWAAPINSHPRAPVDEPFHTGPNVANELFALLDANPAAA